MRAPLTRLLIMLCLTLTPHAWAQTESPAPEPMTAAAEPESDVAAWQSQAASVLVMFAHEPSVLDVQKKASTYAQVNPDVYANWLSRAAWSAILPERLTGELLHTADDDRYVRTSLTATTSDSETTVLELDAQTRLKLFAEWDLSGLIFNPKEYNAAKEMSKLVTRREDLLTTVNKLYFARRQLQAIAAIKPPKNMAGAVKLELQIASLTADLDALTNGWFSRAVEAGAKRKGAGR